MWKNGGGKEGGRRRHRRWCDQPWKAAQRDWEHRECSNVPRLHTELSSSELEWEEGQLPWQMAGCSGSQRRQPRKAAGVRFFFFVVFIIHEYLRKYPTSLPQASNLWHSHSQTFVLSGPPSIQVTRSPLPMPFSLDEGLRLQAIGGAARIYLSTYLR
jgi:hypothetical protein